jgi:hypothetical protein
MLPRDGVQKAGTTIVLQQVLEVAEQFQTMVYSCAIAS